MHPSAATQLRVAKTPSTDAASRVRVTRKRTFLVEPSPSWLQVGTQNQGEKGGLLPSFVTRGFLGPWRGGYLSTRATIYYAGCQSRLTGLVNEPNSQFNLA
ncbi:hypothetical protein V2G26_018265 [Clonostachys chloroleuca]